MKKIASLIISLILIFSSVCSFAENSGGIYNMAYSYDKNGFARVVFFDKWGIVNYDGEFVLDAEYDFLGDTKSDRIKFRKGELYGFLDADFNEIIKPLYLKAEDFSQGFACVMDENGMWGYISDEGETLTDFIFEEAYSFSDGLARVMQDGLYGYIDLSGNIKIKPIFSESYDFSCGLACVLENDLYGYIDKNGEMKISASFDAAWDFCENFAAVKKGDLWSFIDTDGKVMISGNYDRATRFYDGLAPVRAKGGKYGLINYDGKLVIPHKYDFISEFSDGYASVRIDEKYGYISVSGLSVLPCIFDRADSFSNGYAFAVMGEKSGYIDKTGGFVSNETYIDGGKFSGKYANVLYENGLWGFTDFSEQDSNPKTEDNLKENDAENSFSPNLITNGANVVKLKIGDSKIIINGKEDELIYPPVIEEERTLLPIRAVVEAIGGTVLWEEKSKKITINTIETKIVLTVNSPLAKVNNRIIPLEVAPKIYDGATLVPLRFVAENLGIGINWKGKTSEIILLF